MTLVLLASDGPAPIVPAKLDRKDPIDYVKDVRPIFAAKCTVCHSGKITENGYDMSTPAGVIKGGKRGAAVSGGKPMESNLYLFASHAKKPMMPPKSEDNPLTPVELAVIKKWIEGGAKGPAAVAANDRPKVVVGLPPALVKPVRAVAIAPDQSVVAATRGDRVHLYDAKTGAWKKELLDPTLKTPDGKPAAAAHLSLVESLAYSPDGKTLVTGSFREITLWDPAAGTVKKRLARFADKVVALAYSHDGKYLATGGGAPTEDGEVKIFDANTLAPVLDLKQAHSDTVFGLAFSPNDKRLATASADKFVKVWDFPSGKFLKSFEGHTQLVLDVGWEPDGNRLVSAGADNIVKIWDFDKGEKIRDVTMHQKQVTRLAFVGKKNEFLTCGGDGQVRLVNGENGGNMRQYPGATDYLYSTAVSTDGTIVASGGEDGIVRIYNGATAKLIKAAVPPEKK
ncbi:MAG TPA: c-type cytochrome domain-containing protein [Fimbriiglobus sp.]